MSNLFRPYAVARRGRLAALAATQLIVPEAG